MKINEIDLEPLQLWSNDIKGYQDDFENDPNKFVNQKELIHKVDDVYYYVDDPNNYRFTLIAIRGKKVIGYCRVKKQPHGSNYLIAKIQEIWLRTYYRKKSFGFVFYEILLFKMKLVLTGDILYRGGQQSWGRMIQDPRILVFGLHNNKTIAIPVNQKRMFDYDWRWDDSIFAVAADNIPDWMNDHLIKGLPNEN